MTPEEYNKRILKTVADVRTLLDCFAEENILPSQTLEHTFVCITQRRATRAKRS